MNKFLLTFIFLGALFTVKVSAQAPNISYPTPQTFYLGESITPVPVKNTGGAVPARLAPQYTSVQTSEYTIIQDFTRVPSGDIYGIENDMVYRVQATGAVSIFAGTITRGYADGTGTAASFQDIQGIASDASGNLYVTDNNYKDVTNSRIRKITPAGVVTTLVEGLSGPAGITVDSHGIIYFTAGARIMKVTPGGVVSLLAGQTGNGKDNGTGAGASFGYNLQSLTTDKAGNVFVADFGNNLVRKITPDGVVTTVAGTGSYGSQDGMGTAASFFNPSFIRVDSKGNLLVVDNLPSLRKISPEGLVTTVLQNGTNGMNMSYTFPNKFALNSNDDLVTFGGSFLYTILMTGYSSWPTLPAGVVLNPDGSLGGTPTVASSPATYKFMAMNSSGISSSNISIEVAVPKKPPVVTSFSPASAASFSYVSIKGNYFTGTTSVTFAGKLSDDFSVLSPTEISARVPDSAASGTIVVTTPYGSAHVSNFKYLPPPTITSFSPAAGGSGSVITIRGTNFNTATQVMIGGVFASSFTFVSSTTIKATVNSYSNNTGDISVYSNNKSAQISGFTFIGQPAISSASPYQCASGATLTITGSNFNNATSVKFGNTLATSFKVVSPTTITVVVPPNASPNVTITTPYGTANNYYLFNYIAPPQISNVSPMKGGRNSTIYISGNYLDNAIVTIGGVTAQITYAGSTYINAIVGAKGTTGTIKITTPGGTTTLTGFVYIAAPGIASFTPKTAAQGDKVTITGSNFSDVNYVTFGGISSSFKILSPTTIEATVGAGASGAVTVTSAGGSASGTTFTYKGPRIISFSPVNAGADQTVTITGINFTNATGVDFGGVPAKSFKVISSTQISAVVGVGRSGDIGVTTPSGNGTLAGFTHPGPFISYFTPNAAGHASQPQITIYGNNFTGATRVSFGGITVASFTVNSPTMITAVPALSRSGDVLVTTPLGTDTQPGFIWAALPTVTSFTPTAQKTGGQVIITGTNFTGITSVKFGGVPANVYSSTPTTIIAYISNGASGAVSVSTVGGTATRSGFVWTSPSIKSISPVISAAGKTVTINGTGFDSVKSVTFGNINAASFTIVSPQKITAVLGTGSSGAVNVSGATGSAYINGFTFLPPPVIYGISPGTGGTGTEISISGTALTGTSSVKIGSTAATITSVTDNLVKVKAAAGQTGKISLTTIAGTTSFDGFKWYPAPTITSASPLAAGSETQVTINGSNFTALTNVQFGGMDANFTVISPTKIIALPSYVKSGNITVIGPGGTATLPGFTFLPAPVITSFAVAGEAANSTVTITGTNFNSVSNVQFGGVNAKSFKVLSSTSITAVPGTGATGSITVTTTGGSSSIPGFLYNAPPSVLSFSPASGHIGTQVIITGDNFNLSPQKNIVFFGPVQAQVLTATKTALTVNAPACAIGLINVINTDNKLSGSSNVPFFVTATVSFAGFGNKTEVLFNTRPTAYAIDDFDGDGKPDLLIAKDDSLYVLKNTGTPGLSHSSFSQKIIIETGKSVEAMVIGDIDGDGKKDILISIPHCIASLRNTSVNGNLSFEMKVMEYMDDGTGLMLRDINMDGRPDLVIGSLGPQYYENTTTGTAISFGQPSVFLASPGGQMPLSFALTDIDGDNKPDPVLGNSYNDISIYKNFSLPGSFNGFELHEYQQQGYYFTPWSIAAVDLDGDGKPDIIEDDFSQNQLLVSKNAATKGVMDASTLAAPKPFNGTGLQTIMDVVDINGDGRPDLVGPSNTALYYARNASAKGNIVLSTPQVILNNFINDAKFYDIDGDGRMDIITLDNVINKLVIYNNSPKQLPQITSISQSSAATGTTITITGKNFDGTTVVKFGATAAKSFIVTSPQTINAVVGAGSTGIISVQNADGTGTYPGFTFIPAPAITSAVMLSNKTAMTITGQNFTNASSVSIGSIAATSFKVNSATSITAVFPNTSGTLSVVTPGGTATKTGVTYTGVNNGMLSNEQDQADQKLSVYAVADRSSHTVKLSLSGGAPYHLLLNGISYNTNDSLITLPLNKVTNKLEVSTDKFSQGKIEQTIALPDGMTPYPNPFREVLYINIGDAIVKQGTIKIYNLSTGVLKLTKQIVNQSGVISIETGNLDLGVYTLYLLIDSKESVYKIYK